MYTIITGASSGIGKDLAYCFAEEGHNLILIARRINILNNIKEDLINKFNINVEVVDCDFNNLLLIKQVFQEINKQYEINCLVNNAGIGYFDKIGYLNLETINKQINVNLQAPILTINYLLCNLKRNKGSIINVCSILSFIPNMNSSVYTATKHALYGFSNSLRIEYPNLHILTVHPITVRTSFFKDSNYFNKIKKVVESKTVADKIYIAYKRKKRFCYVPHYTGLVKYLYPVFPRIIDFLNRKFFSNK